MKTRILTITSIIIIGAITVMPTVGQTRGMPRHKRSMSTLAAPSAFSHTSLRPGDADFDKGLANESLEKYRLQHRIGRGGRKLYRLRSLK